MNKAKLIHKDDIEDLLNSYNMLCRIDEKYDIENLGRCIDLIRDIVSELKD